MNKKRLQQIAEGVKNQSDRYGFPVVEKSKKGTKKKTTESQN